MLRYTFLFRRKVRQNQTVDLLYDGKCCVYSCFVRPVCLARNDILVWLQAHGLTRHLSTGGRFSPVLFCLAHLLVCAGDVETSPGPEKLYQGLKIVKELIASNDKFQEEVSGKLKDLQLNGTDIKRRLSELEQSDSAINLRVDVSSVSSVLKESCDQLRKIDSKQTQRSSLVIGDLNNRIRRSHLTFRGLPERIPEKWAETEETITKFVSQNLDIQVAEIERAHRIGEWKARTTRPKVVKFLNFKYLKECMEDERHRVATCMDRGKLFTKNAINQKTS
ncbi:hypothetical protein HPB48_003883 [Haemaphysalis longicornis]|uniref:Uncharacterized protein n=1 Tax=Haemaphysalis longicornis TaxID=44386 RepID=A0A9J6FET3_HAELO|nr:hypothetical protein HPB48_003883 [Haemaphysalis longicornis]